MEKEEGRRRRKIYWRSKWELSQVDFINIFVHFDLNSLRLILFPIILIIICQSLTKSTL